MYGRFLDMYFINKLYVIYILGIEWYAVYA